MMRLGFITSRWLRAVTAGVAQQPDWERREAAAAIDPGITGDRWWAKAERDAAEAKIRIVVAVEQETWETAMAPEDDNAIYALRKRLAEAKRVLLVAVRTAQKQRHEDVHIQIARERLEMTMEPARTR